MSSTNPDYTSLHKLDRAAHDALQTRDRTKLRPWQTSRERSRISVAPWAAPTTPRDTGRI